MSERVRLWAGWKSIAVFGAAVLANGLFASFACAQSTLHHLDPLVFCALQMGLLFPGAMILLVRARYLTLWRRQGALAGGLLGVGFLFVAISLRAIGILPTATLTALDGVIASLLAWGILRQPLSWYGLVAVGCASLGAVCLWFIAPGSWQADLVALACGLSFTLTGFVVEHCGILQQPVREWWQPFFGGLFATAASVTVGLALCFGSWSTLQAFTWSDLAVVLYTSLATVALPIVILTILLRSLSAVTIAFLALLEPLLSIGFAFALGSLALAPVGWLGLGCICFSLVVQMRTTSRTRPAAVNVAGQEPEATARKRKGTETPSAL